MSKDLSKIAKQEKNYESEIIHLKNYQEECFKSKNDHNLQGLFYYNMTFLNQIKQIF